MKEELPLVSIVTPSLNQGTFIEATILSVKNQTYTRVEHIVIDGGSTDETLDILRKYRDSIIWVSEPDKGQSDAINKGWRRAKGQILAYLNSDDTYEPWAVETAVTFFAAHPDVSMVYGDCNYINEHSEIIRQRQAGKFDLKMLFYEDNVPQPTVFFKREVLNEVGFLDTNLHMAMDLDFWIRIGLKFKVGYIPRLIANFRKHPGSKTMSKPYTFYSEFLDIYDKTFANPEFPREVRSYAHLRAALSNYTQRQMKQAGKHLLKAFILYPPHLKQFLFFIYAKTFRLIIRRG